MPRPAVRPLAALLALTCATVAIAALPCSGRAATASVDAEGNVELDGQPFFPIGIYHTSWIGNLTGDRTIPDLLLAAEAGFNTFHPTIDNRASVGALLDAAAAHGVSIIAEVPLPASGPDDFIDKWKSHPAMIGWNVADDFNAPYAGPGYNHPPAVLAALAAHVKSLAPEHLTYASGGSYPGYRIAEFLGAMDAMGFQSYPLGAQNHPDDYALQENVDDFDYVRDQLAGSGQLFIANPQAYRWSGAGARYPTPREARNLLYAPLLRGAKGILWYTMWEGAARHLPETAPALWADLPQQVVELKSLTPFLLHGARTELATGSARVHAASWQLAGQLVVAVLSTERSAPHAIALDLPAAATGPALRLFPGRAEAGLQVTGGKLVGSIGPEEVHVALIDLAAAGNASPQASFTPPAAGVAFGETALLDGSSSVDPDGAIVAWEWDFGDGGFASGSSAAHAWHKPGSFFVRLTVRDGGGAVGTAIVPLAVGITSLCAPAPVACDGAGRSSLALRDTGVAAQRTLSWSWDHGAASLGAFGDPRSSTELALCVYDASGLRVATGVRPSATAWTSLGAAGFRANAPSGIPGGITAARLKPAPGAKLSLKGKGSHLPALGLPLALPVTAQLVTSDTGACWQATYAAAAAKSSSTQFRGKSGSAR